MLKVLWFLAVISLVVGENITANAGVTIIEPIQNKNATSTNLSTSNDNKTELRHESVVKNETLEKKTSIGDEGSLENPFEPSKLAELPGEDASMGNFKYYFILMIVSSLSVISIIVFKAMRLRKSRAEIKYGKASMTDRSEVEPLGRSKWLEESSDENEDEIFDINFLKNSRSQNSV